MTTQDKIDGADRIELVIPDGFDVAQCQPLRERPVWKIENGQAVRVVYNLYRGPGDEIPGINDVLPRSEFGVEIHIAVAFLTFIIGISLDKVCGLMKFFWKLDLSKSQADALLNQLARLWEPEFESELLSNLVHELVRLLGEDELFTFVLHPEATGTNNEAERSLRGAALDRRTGRTSKTPGGARRRTILVSVLESLRLHLPQFHLSSVQSEVMDWVRCGESLFTRLLRSSGLAPPETSRLSQLVPKN